MTIEEQVLSAFRERFGRRPAFLVRAPGRVNLIGEHTDYNDGFVMPMAIERAIYVALQPWSEERQVCLTSLDMEETACFPLDDLQRDQATWIEYVKGVAWALQEQGYQLAGWQGLVAGDVPIGAGLSSSAALEIASARAFLAVTGRAWDAAQMARAGQRAENGWMKVNSGIMDQMISAAGQAGHALLIDCRSLQTEAVPLPPAPGGGESAVVILDTGTRRGLVDSAYNERREQCEEAADHFGVSALRDVDMATFRRQAGRMDEVTRRRARHVISENERVLQARQAMRRGDAPALGKLMDASHESLRHDFEVSSEALDTMVEIARRQPGCLGARMTGAGFGGCAVALVESTATQAFVASVDAAYREETSLVPQITVSRPAAGATLRKLN